VSLAIEVEGLTKSYARAKTPALAGVSLGIEEGEIFGLVGPNGAGKTTFMGCLLGLLFPTAGSVRVGGRAPDDLSLRRATGYLPERLQFDRWMTGRGFLDFHHCMAGLGAGRRADDVTALLQRVGLERPHWLAPIKKYSRGMLQRLGMAQALLGEPRFLFLDEPASGVDPSGVLAFREILTDLKQRGTTVILNSHQLDQLERVCDRVAYIEGGRIKQIENLRSAEAGRRVLVVRWLAADTAIDGRVPIAIETIAAEVGARALEVAPQRARLAIADDAQAAALLRALHAAGYPVVEAAPESGRLERLFRKEGEGA
jgi:ABC-2 type transport system ATP-binding protein